MIKIILAEDHHVVRDGIKSLLEKEKFFAITGEATNGAEVLAMLENDTEANIVLADMNMPVTGGLELTEQLKNKFPAVKVIVLSALDHEKYVIKAFQVGARGYLLKSISADELIFAIKHVHQYNSYICSELTVRFLNRLLTIPDPVSNKSLHGLEFTGREIEILELVAQGYTNQEIADKLFTSKRTVENHRQTLIDRTASRNTVSLIRFAMLNGII
jgi:DNA-binding NarL/FixJ family response regulator